MEDVNSTCDSSEPKNPKLKVKKTMKKLDPGIIYLSRIPRMMNVKKLRQILETYGEIGRVFLQPDEKESKKKKNRKFSEGWIEFIDKRVAKAVARTLNTTQIGGKRKNPWFEDIWNMKYLPKFKWGHLNERLAYERAVHQQRMRTEIAQVKKETNFYIQNMEKKRVLARKEKKTGVEIETREWEFTQKETEDEVLSKKRKNNSGDGSAKKKQKNDGPKVKKAGLDKSFLKSLFSGGNKGDSEQNLTNS